MKARSLTAVEMWNMNLKINSSQIPGHQNDIQLFKLESSYNLAFGNIKTTWMKGISKRQEWREYQHDMNEGKAYEIHNMFRKRKTVFTSPSGILKWSLRRFDALEVFLSKSGQLQLPSVLKSFRFSDLQKIKSSEVMMKNVKQNPCMKSMRR